MASRDILVLNTTASRAETQQGSDTVVIKGNSGTALSVENSSNVSILSVSTVSSSVDVAGKITATTNVSSSLSSTGSFGRLEATTLVGDAFNLTNTAIDGTISSSGQIASQISGAFRHGFEFDGTIGSVADHTTTASFDRIVATVFSGSAANLTNTTLQGTLSSSAQIASEISGAFTSGFEFTGTISGSATSTGSFAQIFAKKAVGNVSAMTNLIPKGAVSGSVQLASRISGSHTSGFEFSGTISGSASTTASFANIQTTTVVGDVSGLTGLIPTATVSSSAQIASRVSGSFNKGFEFTGKIQTALGAWSAGGSLNTARTQDGGVGTKAAFIQVDSSGKTEIYNGSSWSEVNDMINGLVQQEAAGSSTSALVFGGYVPANMADSEEWNGTNWATQTAMPISRSNHSAAGQTDADSALAFGGGSNAPIAAPTEIDTVEWNGSSWTTYSETGLGTGFRNGVGFGSTEAALYSNSSTFNKEWNGTAWSSISNTTITHDKGSGGGTVNDGVVFGGSGGGQCTELYDGTAWSAQGALAASRIYTDGGGTVAGNVLAVGAQSSPQNSTVEHFSTFISTGSFGRVEVTSISGDGSNLTNSALAGTISGSGQLASNISGSFNKGFTFSGDISMKDPVFSAGGDLNCNPSSECYTATYRGAAGNKNAGLIFGGFKYSSSGPSHYRYSGETEEYDGTSWTEKNDMIDEGSAAGGGTSEAAIATGGIGRTGCTEEWNGTNWSEVNDQILSSIDTTNIKAASIGQSSEALIMFGFNQSTPYGQTETWNGTNWTATSQMNHDPRAWHGGAGTANAGLTAGGPYTPYNGVSCTETWNGTAWSEGPGALISNMKAVSMAGSSNDTILGGFGVATGFNASLVNNLASPNVNTICWNGISWASSTNFPTVFLGMAAAGESSDVAFFANGLNRLYSSPYYGTRACTIETETFVASASFSHIDGLRITGSVDGMTNIPEPIGTISGSAQIASSVSGSFNKGFEFSGEIRSLGVWSSGANFPGNTGKHGYSAIGTRDAAIVAGARGHFSGGITNTYLYNGSAWSDTGHAMIIGGQHSSHGTANAGLAIGRHNRSPGTSYMYACTEEYNGSAWSETTDLPYKLINLNGQSAGTQNAALTAGGNCDAGNDLDAIKRHALAWDGLSYAHVGTLAEARDSAALAGSMNAALAQGGGSNSSYSNRSAHSTCTEEWNGSVWSEVAASNFPTATVMAAGKSSNDAMHVYDCTNSDPKTDFYNGVAWSLGPNMNGLGSYKNSGATGTTGKSFFMAAGCTDVEHFDENHTTSSMGRVDATELSLESDTDLTIDESLQIPLYGGNPPVTSSAGEVWYNTAEEKLYFTYDINTWTNGPDTNESRTSKPGMFGHIGSALFYGGGTGGSNTTDAEKTELWNGTTWTEVNDLNTARSQAAGVGTTNAGIAAGGYGSGNCSVTEEWNGTNWSETTDINTARGGGGHAGSANASVLYGGYDPSKNNSEEWNGTTWTEGNNLSTARQHAADGGTQNAAWLTAGFGGSPQSVTEVYDGTTWASGTPLPEVNNHVQGAGSQNANLVWGGSVSPGKKTWEYNGVQFSQLADSLQDGSKEMAGTQAEAIGVGNSGVTSLYTTTGIGCHCIGGV